MVPKFIQLRHKLVVCVSFQNFSAIISAAETQRGDTMHKGFLRDNFHSANELTTTLMFSLSLALRIQSRSLVQSAYL